jgi:hypothetical protein
MMKRIRIDRQRSRRKRDWLEDLPTDPRDPDVVRAKALARNRPTDSPRTDPAHEANS